MKHHAGRVSRWTSKAVAALAILSITVSAFSSAAAQENVTGPPDVLQYPPEASVDAPRGLAIIFLRDQIERGADLALCEALMRAAERQIPANFDEASCDPEFAE
jgi:hypothetical protein